jgi:hypothetical protein
MRRRPAPISVKFYGIFWLFFLSFVFFVIFTPSEPPNQADPEAAAPSSPVAPPSALQKPVDEPVSYFTYSGNRNTPPSPLNFRSPPQPTVLKTKEVKEILDVDVPGRLSKLRLEDLWREVRRLTG